MTAIRIMNGRDVNGYRFPMCGPPFLAFTSPSIHLHSLLHSWCSILSKADSDTLFDSCILKHCSSFTLLALALLWWYGYCTPWRPTRQHRQAHAAERSTHVAPLVVAEGRGLGVARRCADAKRPAARPVAGRCPACAGGAVQRAPVLAIAFAHGQRLIKPELEVVRGPFRVGGGCPDGVTMPNSLGGGSQLGSKPKDHVGERIEVRL